MFGALNLISYLISGIPSVDILLISRKEITLIGEFTQLNAFTDGVAELKEHCCDVEKYHDQEAILKSIWIVFSDALHKKLNDHDSPGRLSLYIKVMQNNLTDFSDRIYCLYKDSTPCQENCRQESKNFLYGIGVEATHILEQLSINFPDHFDKSGGFPQWGVFENQMLVPELKRIVRGLEEKRIDTELIHILGSALESIYSLDGVRLKNWQQLFYLRALAKVLTDFVASPVSDDDALKLIRLLIGYNFNPLVFYEYLLDYIGRVVSDEMPYEEQEMELLALLRTFENIRLECKEGYNTEVVPILESVSSFIQRELDILVKMKEVIAPYQQNGSRGRISDYYFEVSTTLEELFFLMRVMLEVRFMKTKFKSNLYNFVAKHIRTDRSKNPSAQYMRNIFGPNREVPSRIIRKVRSWLMIMVNYIDANFGNQLKLWLLGMLSNSFLIEFFFFY